MRDNPEMDAKTTRARKVEVEITSKRYGSNQSPSIKTIEVPLIGESMARLDITLDLRKTDRIEIRPVRRALDDLDGLVEDAERLANS